MSHLVQACSGRPNRVIRAVRYLTVVLVTSLGCVLCVGSSSATAATAHPFVTQFGAFGNPQGLAVDQATGDIYVIDIAAGTVSKFSQDLTPTAFTALGTNVLDGAGAGDCASSPASCDGTPENGFSFDQPDAAQVAIDNSGGPTDGDIYVTDSLHNRVDVFAASGVYLGQMTGTSSGPFGESCGVAVDGGGTVYVGDFFNGVHKYIPSANPATDADFSSDLVTGNACAVATGSAGSLLVNQYHGAVTKYDTLGQQQYVAAAGPVSGLAVDATTDHAFFITGGEVSEYDVSGVLSASLVSSFGASHVTSPSGVAVHSSSGRIYVADNSSGVVAVFGTAALPDATTGEASDVQPTSATVSGIVDPVGTATSWQFEYGLDASYGSFAPATPGDAGSGSGDVTVSTQIVGLAPNTTYHFRLNAANADGTTNGEDRSFTTAGPPIIREDRLFNMSPTAATLSAQLYSGLAPTSYRIEYGSTASYGASAPVPDALLPAGSNFERVKVILNGLEPVSVYHWRLVATNEFGSTVGADHSFQTDAPARADNIPRPPGAVDGRAYELVSQPQKNGNKINVAIISADGNRVLYQTLSGGVPGSTSGISTLFSQRTPAGWSSRNALPPRQELLRSNYFLEATTPDVSEWVAAAKDGLGGTSGSPGVGLARLTDSGSQTVLHVFPTPFGPSGVSVVASEDLHHVFVASPETIDPSHVSGTSNVYDFGGASPTLVSRMPDTGQAPACGVEPRSTTMDFPGAAFNAVSEHWSSTDGSRVFFSTPGDDCAGARQLYMRDLSTATTTKISGSPVAGASDNGIDRFLQATPDGSQVFFRTATSLAVADQDDADDLDLDIYRWTAAGHALTCVTCQVPNANVPQATGAFSNAVIAEDGSHAYFPSAARGAGAPTTGDAENPNLYVWRASDGSVSFIVQIGVANIGLANSAGNGGETTPDGDVLLFQATGPGLDQASGTANGGFTQYYRYDDRDHALSCISCVLGTVPTSDVPTSMAQPFPPVFAHAHVMTDDGRMVFFPTSESLVPQDLNDGPDIYEWHDGAVKLITNGRTDYPAGIAPVPVAVAADGRDFFFLDPAHLTAEAEDGTNKLYDARIGGGFAPTAAAPTCVAEQCQSPPRPAPSLLDPGSASSDSGSAKQPRSRAFTVTRVSRAQRARFARTGRLTLSVRTRTTAKLSARVTMRLKGRTVVVARTSRKARPGVVRLTLSLSRTARRALADHGQLRLVVHVVQASQPARVKHLAMRLEAPGGSNRHTGS